MKINVRTIMFGCIILVCIFTVNYAFYWQFFRNTEETNKNDIPTVTTEELSALENDFKNIFENKLDYQGYSVNITGVSKINSEKDLIYTWVNKEKKVENKYELNLNIPKINIANTSAEKFNDNIKKLYVDKANDIILNANDNTIYTVEYMGYVNTNILSLVIKSTLKEGNNAQRVIIQTYNYNLSTNEEINLASVLEIKGLQTNTVNNTILSKVKEASIQAENLKRLGYNIYERDLSNNMYNVENATNFIIGSNNHLYIIYSYGNTNYTDEMDVIVF